MIYLPDSISGAINRFIMNNNRLIVNCQLNIQLNGFRTVVGSQLKCLNRIFGGVFARSAVGKNHWFWV